MKIVNQEPLSKHTTLKLGGPARYFSEAHSEQELKELLDYAQGNGVSYCVIGEGSNLLVSDEGFDGLIIKNSIKGISVKDSTLSVKSGTRLQDLVDFGNNNGFSGFEHLTGIPGTVGGAIYGNAGAYGQIISDKLIRVKILRREKTSWLNRENCGFAYRDSAFKKGNSIILEAEFRLDKDSAEKLKAESAQILKERLKKYLPGIMCPGSFFKNVLESDLTKEQLVKIPKEKILYGKIPAGYLLEMVGAKGKQLGKIKVADYHGNLFINLGGGTSRDFYILAMEYRDKVKEKFGIEFQPEVQLIGF